jgi:hypothetical protein
LLQPVLPSDNRRVVKREIELSDQRQLNVKISFAAGTLYIKPGHRNMLFKGKLRYSEKEPVIDYSVYNGRATLEISTPNFSKKDKEEKNFNINNLDDIKKNIWYLYFSPDIPVTFNIEMGASKSRFDLGGLRIPSLKVSTGASDTFIDFSEQNPIEMENLGIEAGVSKIVIKHILNSNFKHFTFDGGVGDYIFYFNAPLRHKATVDVDMGVAATKFIMDEEIAYKVHVSDSFLSSVRIEDSEEDEEDTYTSFNYDKDQPYLLIKADTGIVSFKILRDR